MEQTLRQHLRDATAAFHAATGVSPKTVSKRALNDNTFYDRVIVGDQGFTVATYDRVIDWLWSNWPTSEIWPVHVPQPEYIRNRPHSTNDFPAVTSSVR